MKGAQNMYYRHPYWFTTPPYYVYPQVSEEYYMYPQREEVNREYEEFEEEMDRRDYGRRPYVVNMDRAVRRNQAYRSALWTGRRLQVVLMSLRGGEEIGFERHRQTDQFIQVVQGRGLIQIGDSRHHLDVEQHVRKDDAIMIPAGKWHNLKNIGREPLKIFTIYAPPEHPYGTVEQSKKGTTHHSHCREMEDGLE